MYDIEIDDSFNLPLSVAGVILIIYILLGGIMYLFWEDWNYLESIYFVFISISTIGIGDITPAHPKYFIITSIYMFMGLALV
jgi:potassium channel subfamily K protein 16